MLKAVIFDMDGVIIDSEPFHLIICSELFKKFNISVSEEEYNTFTGVSNTSMWTTLKNKYELKETVSELAIIQTRESIKYIRENEIAPIPGVVELLESLKRNGIEIGLASSSAMEGIKTVLDKFKITEYFQAVVSGEDLEKGKPAPDIFLKAATMLQIEPGGCTVIEDSNHGVTAAKAAGMKCVGFQNPNSGAQNLKSADIVVDSLQDVNLDIIRMLY